MTSRDLRRPKFSENTAIHESLFIRRRRTGTIAQSDRSTRFVALHEIPSMSEEAIQAADTGK